MSNYSKAQKEVIEEIKTKFLKVVKKQADPQEFKEIPLKTIKARIQADVIQDAENAVRNMNRDERRNNWPKNTLRTAPEFKGMFRTRIMKEVVPFDDDEYYWEWWGNQDWQMAEDKDIITVTQDEDDDYFMRMTDDGFTVTTFPGDLTVEGDDFQFITFPKSKKQKASKKQSSTRGFSATLDRVQDEQSRTPAQQKKLNKLLDEVAEQAGKASMMRTTLWEKEGFPRKTLQQITIFYRDILANLADRPASHRIPVWQDDLPRGARGYFVGELEKVFRRQFGDYKKFLYNTRTKGKTIAEIYVNLRTETTPFDKKAVPKKTLQSQRFGRLLLDGYIPLFLQHPNTPTAVINSIIEDFKAFLSNNTKSGQQLGRKQQGYVQRHAIDDMFIPYLQDILVLPRLGRKGVADVIRAISKTMSVRNAWVFASLAQNPITTGEQLTMMFKRLQKVLPQRRDFYLLEPAYAAIARNGKLEKSTRDTLVYAEDAGRALTGKDCTPDESMNIRVALASNPNLPKKDLQTLSNDPCMSVAVVARHYLKRRFKK